MHLLYVDNGLMRFGETEEVRHTLDQLGASGAQIVDAEARFLAALVGISDPERKRAVIGSTW